MEWSAISEKSRKWLKLLGDFSPTVHPANRELKGCLEEGNVYFDSNDLRELSAAMAEAADWLDNRAKQGEADA